jgi:hypothetical protein
MRLGWDEVRRRAAAFAADWADAHYERGETQTFWNDFFACFGVERRQVAVYEQRVDLIARKKRGFIDLFWPGVLIIEQKSAGLPLGPADQQALDYFEGIPSERDRPEFTLQPRREALWHAMECSADELGLQPLVDLALVGQRRAANLRDELDRGRPVMRDVGRPLVANRADRAEVGRVVGAAHRFVDDVADVKARFP